MNIPGDLHKNDMHRVSTHLLKNDRTLFRKEGALFFTEQENVAKRDGWYGEWQGASRPMFDWNNKVVYLNLHHERLRARLSVNGS